MKLKTQLFGYGMLVWGYACGQKYQAGGELVHWPAWVNFVVGGTLLAGAGWLALRDQKHDS